MDCQDVYNLMNRYIDGEIMPEEERVLEFHLGRCKGCQREFAELKEMNEFLNTLEPTHDFTQQVMAKVHTGKEQRVRRWLPKTYQGWTAVAATLLVCLFLVHGWLDSKDPQVIISQGQVTQGVNETGENELTVVDGKIEINGLKGSLKAINSQILVKGTRADLHETWWDRFKEHLNQFVDKVTSWFGDQ